MVKKNMQQEGIRIRNDTHKYEKAEAVSDHWNALSYSISFMHMLSALKLRAIWKMLAWCRVQDAIIPFLSRGAPPSSLGWSR